MPIAFSSLIKKANADLAAGLIEDAWRSFSYVAFMAPDAAPALKGVGRVWLRRGMPEAGVRWLEHAWAADSKDIGALFSLVDHHWNEGAVETAISTLRRILSADPDHEAARLRLADCHRERGELERALTAARTAAALHPNSIQAWTALGGIAREAGRPGDAARLYRRAIALGEDSALIRASLGDALVAADRLEAAHDAYRSAVIRQDPGLSEAWRGFGESLARNGRIDAASVALGRAFHLAPRPLDRDADRDTPLPMLLVAMQKSASEYLRELLVKAYALPERRVSVATVPKDRLIAPALTPGRWFARTHADASPENIALLKESGLTRLALQVRDPRQVAVSWTHMIARLSEDRFQHSRSLYQPWIPLSYRDWPFSDQLDWTMAHYFPEQARWLEDWLAATTALAGAIRIHLFRFERLVTQPTDLLLDLARFYQMPETPIVEAMAAVPAIRLENFRLGQVEEWRSVLSADQQRYAETRMGDRLIAFLNQPG